MPSRVYEKFENVWLYPNFSNFYDFESLLAKIEGWREKLVNGSEFDIENTFRFSRGQW